VEQQTQRSLLGDPVLLPQENQDSQVAKSGPAEQELSITASTMPGQTSSVTRRSAAFEKQGQVLRDRHQRIHQLGEEVSRELSLTGSNAAGLAFFGFGLLVVGLILIGFSRRRHGAFPPAD
jgi:hypothetical protein